MIRITVLFLVLLGLGGCQGTETPPSTADRCAELEMQISATQDNDSLQQDAKDDMIMGFEQEKAELNCP